MMNCVSPFRKDGMDFPCGRCYYCLSRRASGWSFRLMREDRVSRSSFFLTLTYANEYVHVTGNHFLTLSKRDVQLFIKRLRKLHIGSRLRYFAVGEYGGQYDRPHYHVIIFNLDLALFLGEKVATQIRLGNMPLDGKHQYFPATWPAGNVTIGRVSDASVGYTLKYMLKPTRVPVHQRDDRVPEFQLMSKGLGASYLTKQMIRWHKDDLYQRMYVPLLDGKKIAMPRYYKEKIYSKLQRQLIGNHMRLTMDDKFNLDTMQEIAKVEHGMRKLKRSRLKQVL